uniref:RRM domain-containing protein n=1 Tax=Nelumbo nucifera TaxID=4432 RepID=A0A822ZY92_NELNU|nr:TPA_asm: hypothetical protein HUJ06_018262 [Nelumbo nucifera]
MAMAATATASTSASIVRLHNRLTNLSSFDHHLFVTVAIAGAAITRKHQTQILKFKAQNPHLPLLSLRSPSHLCYVSSAFESFEDPEENEAIADDEEEEGHDERTYAEERRLYVGNLPFSMTSSHLAEVFSEAGQVDAVEIIYDRVTDRSRGFAFVTMGSAQDAKEAIRMFDGSVSIRNQNLSLNREKMELIEL